MLRRIRTDHLDALRKNQKQPLADNRRLTNYNQSSQPASKNTKKPNSIKSFVNKNNTQHNASHLQNNIHSRLTTETN